MGDGCNAAVGLQAMPGGNSWRRSKLGRAGDRFGDNLCVDCANFPCVSGSSHFKNTNFARPINKMLKSKVETGW